MFRRNVGRTERTIRILAGGLMICSAVVVLGATPAGWALGATGAVTLLTGLVRYCPACAIAGRSPAK